MPAGESTVLLRNADRADELVEFDSIVLVGTRTADDDLYRQLHERRGDWAANEISGVYRAGDCVRPHFIADAIFSGHRLAREIDSDDPTRALPFIRERRIIGGQDSDFLIDAEALRQTI